MSKHRQHSLTRQANSSRNSWIGSLRSFCSRLPVCRPAACARRAARSRQSTSTRSQTSTRTFTSSSCRCSSAKSGARSEWRSSPSTSSRPTSQNDFNLQFFCAIAKSLRRMSMAQGGRATYLPARRPFEYNFECFMKCCWEMKETFFSSLLFHQIWHMTSISVLLTFPQAS